MAKKKKLKKRSCEHEYLQKRVKAHVHKDKSKEIPRKKKYGGVNNGS